MSEIDVLTLLIFSLRLSILSLLFFYFLGGKSSLLFCHFEFQASKGQHKLLRKNNAFHLFQFDKNLKQLNFYIFFLFFALQSRDNSSLNFFLYAFFLTFVLY